MESEPKKKYKKLEAVDGMGLRERNKNPPRRSTLFDKAKPEEESKSDPKAGNLLEKYMRFYKEPGVPSQSSLRALLRKQEILDGRDLGLVDDLLSACSESSLEEKVQLLMMTCGSILNFLTSKKDLNLNSNSDLSMKKFSSIETKLDGMENKIKEFSSVFRKGGGTPSTLFGPPTHHGRTRGFNSNRGDGGSRAPSPRQSM